MANRAGGGGKSVQLASTKPGPLRCCARSICWT